MVENKHAQKQPREEAADEDVAQQQAGKDHPGSGQLMSGAHWSSPSTWRKKGGEKQSTENKTPSKNEDDLSAYCGPT